MDMIRALRSALALPLTVVLSALPACSAEPVTTTDLETLTGQVSQASTSPETQQVSADRGNIFVLSRDGDLIWYGDGARNGTAAWLPGSGNRVSPWFGPVEKVSVAPGGDIYTIDAVGRLRWYKLDPSDLRLLAPGSGNVIGTGWNVMTKVWAAGDGILYAVDTNGDLHWYKDLARNGTASWAAHSGAVIGNGWQNFEFAFSDSNDVHANGIIYAIDQNGDLHWYQDVRRDGTKGWAWPNSGKTIGWGWQSMRHVFSGADGIIYAVDENGKLHWYQDAKRDGTSGWTWPGSGTAIGSEWLDISYKPSLEVFGYESARVNHVPAKGTRPLVVLLAQYSDSPALTHGAAFYDALAFGHPYPPFSLSNPASLSAYVAENSNGQFLLSRAGSGVVGPLSMGPFDPTLTASERTSNIVMAASQAGFDFTPFDANGDGKLTADELLVVTVDNRSGSVSGSTETAPLGIGGKTVSLRTANVGGHAPFMVFARELLRTLGAQDLSGDGCANAMLTPMTCSWDQGQDDAQSTVHLDAWNKLLLGWIRPETKRLETANTACVQLARSTRLTGPVLLFDGASVFVQSPQPPDFFIFDRRTATFQEEQPLIYDADVPGDGIAIWDVAQTSSAPKVTSRAAPALTPGGAELWKGGDITPVLAMQDGRSTTDTFTFTGGGSEPRCMQW